MKMFAVALVGLAFCVSAARGEDSLQLETTDLVSNLFPGKICRREIAVTAGDDAWDGQVQWRLLANQRTLASRSAASVLKAKERQLLVVEVTLPELATAEAIPLEFLVEAVVKPGTEPIARHREILWILPENPFADRLIKLKELPLTLFDPVGKTKEAFDALEIPYDEARDLTGISNVKQGILILGEGTSFREWKGVVEETFSVTKKGVSVLCLAAAVDEDLFPWEFISESPHLFHKSRFERRNVIRELAPRVSLAWNTTTPVESQNLILAAKNNEVFVRTGSAKEGWPWLELRREGMLYPTWVYCGLGVVRDWNQSPAARHFLVRLLDYVTSETPCKPKTKEEVKP